MTTKHAFLVGINDYKISPLRGCVNDVIALGELLVRKYNFDSNDITSLYDADATSNNIKQGLANVLRESNPGDTVIFGYAGHGTQKGINIEGEIDGKNEALVPFDMSYNTLITDTKLHEIIMSFLASKEVNFTAIYDCCHSGTMIRSLDFNDTTGKIYEPVINRSLNIEFPQEILTKNVVIGPYNVFSACKDEETAADLLNLNGVPRGAFSYALQKVLDDSPNIIISNIEERVSDIIENITTHKQNPTYFAVNSSSRVFTNS
ncbi:MAG: caspase family protein [Rhodobacteraceae bacterium]|nr:caspase family protein [Paracoccaceae bacterium]